MAEPLSMLIRPDNRPVLPVFERFAPPPSENLIAAEIDARTSPGDIVIELHGRGGWVARAGVDRLRRVYDLESSALTRLLADVVLRPPDLRHFDAALNALAVQPRRDVGFRQSLDELYGSTCANCERAVVVEEFIWDGDAEGPSRKSYRCESCREQARAGEQRAAPVVRADILRATAAAPRGRAWDDLRARFPAPDAEHPLLDELLSLYTPRNLEAIHALIERIDGDLRAAPIQAALRLALLHVLLPASRLNSYPGRMASLRIVNGRVRLPPERHWRERNVWSLFEEGCRHVRAFLQRLESVPGGTIQARVGADLLALIDGSANVVLKHGGPALVGNVPSFAAGRPVMPGRLDPRSRIRLVLTQSPVRWTTENLSFAYLATSLLLGRDAARTLPTAALFGPAPRAEWGWEAAALRRSLLAVRPVLAPDATAVVVLDRGGPGNLVAGVLGGVGAGYPLSAALLTEVGDDMGGILEFASPAPPEDASAAPRARPSDATRARSLAGARADEPFRLEAVEQAVSDVAVAVLQERGEPARFERLLGEVLVGLDRLGHLRRLVGTQTFTETEQRAEAEAAAHGLIRVADPDALVGGERDRAASSSAAPQPAASLRGYARMWPLNPRAASASLSPRIADPPDRAPATAALRDPAAPEAPVAAAASSANGAGGYDGEGTAPTDEVAAAVPSVADARPPSGWSAGVESASDHVKLMLEIVLGELRRPEHARLQEIEPGRWWLRDPTDIDAARAPLSDRLEWAVFSLLSTSRGLTESAFFDRVAGMFRGHDTPDRELVRACLESYRSQDATATSLRTDDDLQGRASEHTELVGMLTEYGHRLGLRAWISRREQRRLYKERPLSELLTEVEQRVYLPLVVPGPAEALEAVDCLWYIRGKAAFLFEVEWTAILSEPLLRRGRRIPSTPSTVRFLVIPPERTELVRLKLARSPLLQDAMAEGNWHILKSDHLRRLFAQEKAGLELLEPFLGLDPGIERQGEQLALFG